MKRSRHVKSLRSL